MGVKDGRKGLVANNFEAEDGDEVLSSVVSANTSVPVEAAALVVWVRVCARVRVLGTSYNSTYNPDVVHAVQDAEEALIVVEAGLHELPETRGAEGSPCRVSTEGEGGAVGDVLAGHSHAHVERRVVAGGSRRRHREEEQR